MAAVKNRITDVGRGIRTIFSDMSETIALSTMEGIVLGVFDQFSLEELYASICDDRNLWAENWGKYEQHRGEIMLLMKDPRYVQYKDYLTVENVLEWLRRPDGKPEFASIIVNTPGGAKWLEAQINSLLQVAEQPIDVRNMPVVSGKPVDAKQVTPLEVEVKTK